MTSPNLDDETADDGSHSPVEATCPTTWKTTSGTNLGPFRLAIAIGCLAAFFSAAPLLAADNGYRTWTDASGKFSLKAEFIKIVAGKVVLEQEDGRRRRIILERLCPADRTTAESLQAENPFVEENHPDEKAPIDGKDYSDDENPFVKEKRPDEEASPDGKNQPDEENPFADKKQSDEKAPAEEGNPFKGAETATSPKPGDSASKPGSDDKKSADEGAAPAKPIAPVAWAQVPRLHIPSDDAPWKITLGNPPSPRDPESVKPTGIAPSPINLSFTTEKGVRRFRGLVANPVCERAVAVDKTVRSDASASERNQLHIFLCDCKTGKLLHTFTMNRDDGVPLALDDAGARLLLYTASTRPAEPARLEIVHLDGNKLREGLQWIPCGDERFVSERDAGWGVFDGADRVLTLSKSGKLAAWDLKTAQPIYWVQAAEKCRPALSPDRKYLAFLTENSQGIALLDIKAGKIAASQSLPQSAYPSSPALTFTPNGTHLVCLGSQQFLVFNTADGTLDSQQTLPDAPVADGGLIDLIGLSEHRVFLYGRTLYDLQLRTAIWTYDNHQAVQKINGFCWFALAVGESHRLLPLAVPHREAEQAIQAALKTSTLSTIFPGEAVRLDVSKIPDSLQRNGIETLLTARLRELNHRVDVSGDATLAAAVTPGPRHTVRYREQDQSKAETYTFQPSICSLTIRRNGRVVRTFSNVVDTAPLSTVRLAPDETMQDYLRKQEQPDYAWFTKADLPQHHVKTSSSNRPGFGSSRFTASGIE